MLGEKGRRDDDTDEVTKKKAEQSGVKLRLPSSFTSPKDDEAEPSNDKTAGYVMDETTDIQQGGTKHIAGEQVQSAELGVGTSDHHDEIPCGGSLGRTERGAKSIRVLWTSGHKVRIRGTETVVTVKTAHAFAYRIIPIVCIEQERRH